MAQATVDIIAGGTWRASAGVAADGSAPAGGGGKATGAGKQDIDAALIAGLSRPYAESEAN